MDGSRLLTSSPFILQKNNLLTGQAELPIDADALKAIKFLAKKP